MGNPSLSISAGNPLPLGVSQSPRGINFAFRSNPSSQTQLLLFHPGEENPFFTTILNEEKHKSEGIWHVCIENLKAPFEYTYKTYQGTSWSSELFDPYSKYLSSASSWNAQKPYNPRSQFFETPSFDWQGVSKPQTPFKDWIIYEMHVRGFTQDPSSQTKKPGTFLGLIEKIPHLKSLGINAVELLPIFEFNECENKLKNPISHEKLVNFWGYSPMHFFCPMKRYAYSKEWNAAILECKEMVRELHRNGIAVILDVVYNHTGECGEDGSTVCFKGFDKEAYYHILPNKEYANYSGTGNTLNCNHPITTQLIIDSLVYWVEEMHIDGFRFDLASILTRGLDGNPMANPPVLQAMKKEPKLAGVHFLAEAWDAACLYQVGNVPGGDEWSEWNGKFRDIARNFFRGSKDMSGAFARVICGSQDLYWKHSPLKSINFITAHDGYSLYDLVSYEQKHNIANGELNKDGENNNNSWNCGEEGPSIKPPVLSLRQRQMKNFILSLMVSLGVPMILMGDEYAHTRLGNNNPYCQDTKINWFLWDEVAKHQDILAFFQKAIAFRKKHADLFCRQDFLSEKEVTWHGVKPFQPLWDKDANFIAYSMTSTQDQRTYYICFNAQNQHLLIQLPIYEKKPWNLLVDTSLASSYDLQEPNENSLPYQRSYLASPYSAFILVSG